MNPDVILSYGLNCKKNDEKLIGISLDDLIKMIREDQIIAEQTSLLRTIYKVDKERYRHMKTRLPYFSCSTFDQGSRGFDRFEYACGWVLDIDADKPLPQTLIENVRNDTRVRLSYLSPNSYGLKLLFLFDTPYTDKVNYAKAYKSFATEFGVKYGISELIDKKNCDVSRICFICHDQHLTLNSLSETIDVNSYSPTIFHISQQTPQTELSSGIDSDIYKTILHRLGTKPKIVHTDPYTPHQLLAMIDPITTLLASNQIIVHEHEKVQYGIKFKAQLGSDIGEVIVYQGKKGCTVVTSARKGLHHPLNDVMKQIIEYYLMTIHFLT